MGSCVSTVHQRGLLISSSANKTCQNDSSLKHTRSLGEGIIAGAVGGGGVGAGGAVGSLTVP